MPSYYQQINLRDTLISSTNLYRNPNAKRPLPPSFQPGPYDVLCARGRQAYDHIGNQRFRALVNMHKENYASAVCKYQKSKIVSHIVDTVRQLSTQGGFVKLIKGVWYETGDRTAKEKVGQTFRDLLHTKYSSSTKAKARARIRQRIEQCKSETAQSLHLTKIVSRDTTPEFDENRGGDDDSVERGAYPSLAQTTIVPSSIDIVIKCEKDNKPADEPNSHLSNILNSLVPTKKLAEQERSISYSDLEPLSLDDDSMGDIDSLIEPDLCHQSSSTFEADMKALAEFMGVIV